MTKRLLNLAFGIDEVMSFDNKIIGGLLMVLVVLGVASADYSDYDVSLKVLPGVAFEDNDILVAGYITIDDWSKIVDVNKFKILIIENTKDGPSTKRVLYLSDPGLEYQNDLDDESLLVDGFYYTTIKGLDAGNYLAKVLIDDQEVKLERFTVLKGETNFTVYLDGFTNSEGPYASVLSDNNSPVTVDAYYYGRNNFDNPTQITINNVQDEVLTEVPMITGFDLSDYVGEGKVYGLILYGTASGVPATPRLIIRNNGLRTDVYDGSINIIEKTIKKGASQSLALNLENNGELSTTFSFEFSGSLSPYVTNPGSFTIEPNEEVNTELMLDIPEDYTGTGSLTVKLLAGSEVVAEKTMTLIIQEADPEHSVSVSNVSFDKDSYLIGDTVTGTIDIVNDGDYTENLEVQYYFDGDAVNKAVDVMIAPGTTKEYTIVTTATESSLLNVKVNNSELNYAETFTPTIMPKTYDFNYFLRTREIITQDSYTKNVTMTVENTGNVKDVYVITADYPNIELSKKSLILEPGESSNITATISIPLNQEELPIEFSACAQRGDSCKTDDLDVSVFWSEPEVESKESVVNITETSLSGSVEDGVVYEFDVTNNQLITKDYAVSYVASGNVSFNVFPNESFTVLPGETVKVFMYATPAVNGDYDINYTFTEGGVELASGNLTLTTNTGFNNLTGFAVAAGSVLGVAGLIVLILFIYFYFIKQPPEGGEDEFRPVEVKKADLTKPDVKKEAKYW